MSFTTKYPNDLPDLPPNLNCDIARFSQKLLKARVALAELKGYIMALPNPMILLRPSIIQESVASSEIENINTTVENVFQQQLFPESEQKTEN